MAYSDLNDLFLSPDYRLPYIEADDTKSFLHLFDEKMHRFIADLDGMDVLAFKTTVKDEVITDLKVLSNSINKVLEYYLNGYPSEAYILFKQTIDEDDLFHNINSLRQMRLEDGTAFFRSKKNFDDKAKGNANGFVTKPDSHDMFHVPFEKRRAIGTNRYSIPGFPCIYLSDHLQTSWSECMGDELEPFYAICYRNHRPLYLVDLVPLNILMELNGGVVPDGLYSSMNQEQALINYAKVYPIICACHSKINYKEDYSGEVKFKSEYIISQLLMQWYRESNVLIDGIRYLSCTAETKFPKSQFDKHNYVIPVDLVQEVGLCPSLVVNFSGSPVYSYNTPTSQTHEELLLDIQNKLSSSSVTPLN